MQPCKKEETARVGKWVFVCVQRRKERVCKSTMTAEGSMSSPISRTRKSLEQHTSTRALCTFRLHGNDDDAITLRLYNLLDTLSHTNIIGSCCARRVCGQQHVADKSSTLLESTLRRHYGRNTDARLSTYHFSKSIRCVW
jgi:hypothetical protein